ncbi:glycosyltransferase family 2 protein [Geitlerinema sp. PCC 9228]|jgi:glycosyltransferase involved in cell wall biosynthesis|uniref:glycosyltransferase family 2 protein n=1 Tax=Geitlerinema sp. PCC 9228 TaxID=111611 RepID=UPI0008F9A93D|nr:glycosyltransferase family 2 protein [Geitlerinema sp. PCC 9228]
MAVGCRLSGREFHREDNTDQCQIAVVIPCYRVKPYIAQVIDAIPNMVDWVYVVDDGCPDRSGEYVEKSCCDARVRVIYHQRNQGVGGAVISGYQQAIADGATIILKIDGDGQMDPALIPKFVSPIRQGIADYVKGNRFFELEHLQGMPAIRLLGNAALSFANKIATGYWDIMDPTNGYTAIHAQALQSIPLHKLDRGYFFESDILFRLSTVRAVVYDVPMRSKYTGATSHLNICKVIWEFPGKYLNRLAKRIFYNYYLRDFNIGSLEFLVAILFIGFGGVYGIFHWYLSFQRGIPATSGTVMAAALPVILGFQSLLAAIHYDVANVPRIPIHRLLM